MGNKHTIDGVDVELDADIDPADVERHGSDPRDDDAIDWDRVERDAADTADVTEAVGE